MDPLVVQIRTNYQRFLNEHVFEGPEPSILTLRYRRPADCARVEDTGDGDGNNEHGQDVEVVFRYNDDGQDAGGDTANAKDDQDTTDEVGNGNDDQNPKGKSGTITTVKKLQKSERTRLL
jgi:hypothetical protein